MSRWQFESQEDSLYQKKGTHGQLQGFWLSGGMARGALHCDGSPGKSRWGPDGGRGLKS